MTTPDASVSVRSSAAGWIPLIAAGCGAAIWIAIALSTGKHEAWDSGVYFSAGLPATYLVSFVSGLVAPRQWAWVGVAPFSGQFLALVGMAGVGNMLPLGIMLFAVMSVPGVIAAWIGALIRRRLGKSGPERSDPS